jgi:hypothetical protein
MRKTKLFTIEGRGEVIVREVSPMAVYRAWSADERLTEIEALLDECVTPGGSELREWYASEIEQVMAAFLEVNGSFFGIARQLKIDGLAQQIMAVVAKSLPAAFADSLATAMPTPGTTAGLSS